MYDIMFYNDYGRSAPGDGSMGAAFGSVHREQAYTL